MALLFSSVFQCVGADRTPKGTLVNGGIHAGDIANGETHSWTIEGESGDSLVVRMGTFDVSPHMLLYEPDGAPIQEVRSNGGDRIRDLTESLKAAGSYTLVVGAWFGSVGSYELHVAHVPGGFIVPVAQELNEGDTMCAHLHSLHPIDPAKQLICELVSAPIGLPPSSVYYKTIG